MKHDQTDELPEEVEGEIIPTRRGGISWAWLFPLLALAATAWLFWSNWKAKGPEIVVHFATAPGIEPGKSVLIYRGVQAGKVSKVHLDADLGTVAVSISLKAFAKELAVDGTDYWIEQPVISLREIAGLESIIQGNSIHARTHGAGPLAKVFHGLETAPLAPLDAADLVLKLRSDSIPFIGRGTPVFHRGVNVGTVREKSFDASGRPEIEVIIFENYTDKVDTNSRFWSMPATSVSASPGTLRLDIPSMQGLLDGSISFDHFDAKGGRVASGAKFELAVDEATARADGPLITISFAEGAGLRAGETRVTSLGQPIGLVKQVTVDPSNKRVEVTARLQSGYSALATEDSVFTIVRPSVGMKGISGLDTLVTGPTIAFIPGQGKAPASSFVGRETPQIDFDLLHEDKDATRVTLWAKTLPQMQAGAPVYHHGMIAGHVVEQRMGATGNPEVVISIDGKFREFLRINTRFWRVPAAVLAVGPGVIGVEVQGLSSLLQGGIAFDSFGSPGSVARETPAYELHASEMLASAISDPIRIIFDDGQGLLAGKTELRYLGVVVGIVEKVNATEGKIEATARFQPGYDFLRRRGSEFAIVRPQIDLKGVHGLDTVIGGPYISCAPGNSSEYTDTFSAEPPAAIVLQNETGLEIVLESPATKIDAGAPVSYNETPVGEVVSKTLTQDGKRILLTARIRDEHRNLVRTNSVFWDSTRIEAKIGFMKVQFDAPSVVAPAGRIEFHTPDNGGTLAKKRTVFRLLDTAPKIAESKPEASKTPPFRKR